MPTLKKTKRNPDTTEVNNAAKTLLANIRFMDVDHPVKTVVVTSAIPNEGKSYISQILSEAIATSGKTVLLMEGDLRRRSLAARLGVHARRGIYSILSGEAAAEEAIIPTKTENMFFLDAEPNIPNPSDLFASHRFSRFLSSLAKAYDYVVIDTPPVNAFVDAAVLSYLADATFLVVRENFAHRDQVRSAADQLRQTGGKVSGVIMNYCKHQSSDYYYSYYYKDKEADKDPSLDVDAARGGSAPMPKIPVPAPTKPRVSKLPSTPKFNVALHGNHAGASVEPGSTAVAAPTPATPAAKAAGVPQVATPTAAPATPHENNPYLQQPKKGSSVGFTPASQGIFDKAKRRH